MTERELRETLDLHRTWISSNCAQGMQANLSHFDLSDRDLAYSELKHAKLMATNLSCSDLRDTHLAWADLHAANLNCADFSNADLTHPNL